LKNSQVERYDEQKSYNAVMGAACKKRPPNNTEKQAVAALNDFFLNISTKLLIGTKFLVIP
jgi:hypothetical protein